MSAQLPKLPALPKDGPLGLIQYTGADMHRYARQAMAEQRDVHSTEAGGQTVPGLHPNHLPDLRYVLRVLEWVHLPGHQTDVEAAITSMRHIIKRAEEALARNGPAESPRPDEKESAAMEVLREMVAVNDIKERAVALYFAGPSGPLGEGWEAEWNRLQRDYIERQPKAWAAARSLLSSGTTDA